MSVVKFITATGAPANGHAISVYAHGTTTPVIASGTTDANGEISVALTTQTQYDFGATNSSGDQVGGTFYLQPGNFITTAVFTGSGITASNLPTPTVTSITVANATTPGGLSADVAANVTVTNVPIDGSVFALAYFFRASGTVIWTPYGNEQMPTPIAASVTMPQFVYGQLQNGYSYDFAVGYLGPNGYGPTTTIKTGFTANAVVVVTSNIPAPTVAPTFTSVTVASVSTPTSIAADVGANLTVTNVPQNGSTIGVAYFFRQNGTTPWVPYGEEPFSSQTPPASVVMPQFVYGQLQNGIAYDFAIAYYGAGGVGPLATIFTNLTAHAIVVTTPYLIGTTSPVPTIAAGATATAVPSANGLAAGVTLAFTVTNQPTDGSLQRLSIWFRVYNSSGVPGPWTFDTSIAAAGLPTPSASQAYSVTISDLTNGQQYDFGVTYENAQGSDSSTVGVVFTGFTATTIVITTPYLIGTTSPVPTVTSVTVTNGTSDNGIAAAVTLAFTLTNQPTDGSLRRITIWFRKTGDTNWTFYSAQGAAGLPNPTSSAAYTITLADLTNGNTYDFGVKYENAQGADSATTGVIYSGWNAQAVNIPVKALPTLAPNLVTDSGLKNIAAYWYDSGSWTWLQGGDAAGDNNYILSAATYATVQHVASNQGIPVPNNQWVAYCGYVDSRTVTAGGIQIELLDGINGTVLASSAQTNGVNGRVVAYWQNTTGASKTVYWGAANLANTTVSSSIAVAAAPSFYFVTGTGAAVPPYIQNENPVGGLPSVSLQAMPSSVKASGPTISSVTMSARTNRRGIIQSAFVTFTETDFTAKPSWIDKIILSVRINGDTNVSHQIQIDPSSSSNGSYTQNFPVSHGDTVDVGLSYSDVSGQFSTIVWPSGWSAQADADGDFMDPGDPTKVSYGRHHSSIQNGVFTRNGVVNGNNTFDPSSFGWINAYLSGTINAAGNWGSFTSLHLPFVAQNAGRFQDTPVIPGQTYTYAALAYAQTSAVANLWIGKTDYSVQINASPGIPVGSILTGWLYSGAPAVNGSHTTATATWQVLYGTCVIPSGVTTIRVLLQNTGTAGDVHFQGVQFYPGSRLQDYIDHELNVGAVHLARHVQGNLQYGNQSTEYRGNFDTSGSAKASTFLNKQGSLLNVAGTPVQSYSSTSTSITITIPATTYTRTDGSTVSVAQYSNTWSGLTPNTTYYWNLYYDVASNSYGAAYYITTPPTATQQLIDCLVDGRQAIVLNYSAATPLSGTGGGSGGGTRGCPADNQLMLTKEHGWIRADKLDAGMHIQGPKGWVEILEVSWRPAPIWQYIVTDGVTLESFDVNDTHSVLDLNGNWRMVRDLKPGDKLQGTRGVLSVVDSNFIKQGHYCPLEVEGHIYVMGDSLVHNYTTQ